MQMFVTHAYVICTAQTVRNEADFRNMSPYNGLNYRETYLKLLKQLQCNMM
jgi:hypothetical protein